MRRNIGNRAAAAGLLFVAAVGARADEIVVFNTGVDAAHLVLPAGAPDPHYSIVAAPAGAGLTVPRAALAAAAHSAYVPNSAVGTAGSSWIAPFGSTATNYAPGAYVYRTTFDLTGLDPSTARIDGIYGSDNLVADVIFNGVSTGITGGAFFVLVYPVTLTSGFVSGVNTLDFVVVNAGGAPSPHGFRLIVSGSANPTAPADQVGPVITGCTDHSFGWTGSAVALTPSLLGITAVDDVDGPVPVLLAPAYAGLGDTLVTASATDAAGNTTSCSFTVHVLDVTAPVIAGPTPATPTYEWHGAPIALSAASLALSATDDVDAAVTVSVAPSSVGVGDNLVTATATDAAGNTATKSFTVRVLDVTAPVVSGPSPATPTFEWHGASIELSAASLGLSASDDVDGAVAVGVAPSSVGLGDTLVTATATDAAGNTATKSFTVRVVDVTAPVIAGPTPATPTFEWQGAPIALSAALLGLSATDDVDGSVAVGVAPSSAGKGDTLVTATAVDAAGNTTTKSFTVRVLDTVAPSILSLTASPNVLDDRNHKMADVVVSAVVADAGDVAPTVRIVSVTSIDAGVTTGPSTSSANWTITGDLSLQLRAERTGAGSNRTYVIAVQATDASGNVSTATVSVVVLHDSSMQGDASTSSSKKKNK
jgi:hypothetical protein